MPERHVAELDRLLGGSGHDPANRLALPEHPTTQDVTTAALDSVAHWQRLAEHPLSSCNLQVAARGATRTLEGILATTGPAPIN